MTSPLMKGGLGVAVILAIFVGSSIIMDRTERDYIVKAKFAKVMSALDPIENAVSTAYKRHGRAPLVPTVLTAANQGKAATPDWAGLGFATLPALPPEVRTLRVGVDGEIVFVLANVAEGIDDAEVYAMLTPERAGQSWAYKCSSEDGRLKKYFRC